MASLTALCGCWLHQAPTSHFSRFLVRGLKRNKTGGALQNLWLVLWILGGRQNLIPSTGLSLPHLPRPWVAMHILSCLQVKGMGNIGQGRHAPRQGGWEFQLDQSPSEH